MSETQAETVILDRSAILAAQDLVFEVVPVPEWGGSVRIRSLTANERDLFETSISEDNKKKKVNIRARLASLVMVDANGNRMFGELDVELLARKSGAALDRVFQAASKANGLTTDDIKELEKNSESAPSGA